MGLLVIYLDAWPYRFIDILLNRINNENEENAIGARLIPVYGYTDTFKVSLLTGLYPDEHNYWISYGFSSKPVRKTIGRHFNLVLDVDIPPIRGIRFLMNKFAKNHMFHMKIFDHIVFQDINPESPFLEIDKYLRSRGFDTLFNYFQNKSLKYYIIEDRFYGHDLNAVARSVMKKIREYDIIFLYIDEPDFWGHKYGLNPYYVDLIGWLSNIVSKIVKISTKCGFEYVIFSDHGMSNVRHHIDLYHYVERDPLYGRKYLVGIDATFFRIFYIDENTRSNYLDKIRKILNKCACKLDTEKMMYYRLPRSRFYGDEIYGLHDGIVLFPNFFSWMKPKGMHAFSPNNESQHGIVIHSYDELYKDTFTVPELHTLIKEMVS